jgi:hypothetical protein
MFPSMKNWKLSGLLITWVDVRKEIFGNVKIKTTPVLYSGINPHLWSMF